MSDIRGVLYVTGGGTNLGFLCPGCGEAHVIPTRQPDGARPSWEFNGSFERPTFQPSILVTWGPPEDRARHRCHSYVTDGQIQFLDDCTHALKGQSVPLPPFAWRTE